MGSVTRAIVACISGAPYCFGYSSAAECRARSGEKREYDNRYDSIWRAASDDDGQPDGRTDQDEIRGWRAASSLCRRPEIIRRVYFAVRDKLFGTAGPVFDKIDIQQQEHGFHILLSATCKSDLADYRWTGEMTGRADGTITFSITGQADSSFPVAAHRDQYPLRRRARWRGKS